MTNTDVSTEMALKDRVRLVTLDTILGADSNANILIEVDEDSTYDYFVEIADGSADALSTFNISDNVVYTNGTEIPISTSVIDGVESQDSGLTAFRNVTISDESNRYSTKIGGGQSGNRSSGRAKFTQALIKAGYNYMAVVTNNTSNNIEITINIRLWRINN